MSQLKIRLGDQIVRAKLLEDNAPRTCEIVKAHLPMVSRLSHAKICDNEVFFQVPFFIDEKENFTLPKAGDIGFWNVRQTICVWYDQMEPLGPTILFARIIENLEGFKKVAMETWSQQGAVIRVELG